MMKCFFGLIGKYKKKVGLYMLKKIIKGLLKSQLHSKGRSHYKHYSSSGYKKRKHYGHHPSQYGHKYYKKKHKSSGFFRSYSSS
jgi:hypothetical protein